MPKLVSDDAIGMFLLRFFFGLKTGDREGRDHNKRPRTSDEHNVRKRKRKVRKVLPPEMKTIRARQDHRDGEWRSKLCCRAGLRSSVSVFLL